MKYLLLLMTFSFSAFSYENCTSENLNNLESCSARNYKEEDSKLNSLYKELISSYPELKENIKNTQKLWVKARDSICDYSQKDGEEYKIYQNSCLYEQTYERNRELKAIISKQSGQTNISNQNSSWNEYIKSHCNFMQGKYSDNECMARNKFLHSQ